jgi:haloacetate dehalogenase
MQRLGFSEFAVVGHDRGARVAHRMALDYAGKITKLALLDIIPTRTAFANVDKEMAVVEKSGGAQREVVTMNEQS